MRAYEYETRPPANPAGMEAPGSTPGLADAYGFLRGLIQGMRCGILSVDIQGRLILLNEHARKILDLPEVPAPGMPLHAALPRHPHLVRALISSFDMASLPNRAELELGPAAPNGKTIGYTVSMVRGQDGRPHGAAMFFKDLTQIEHAEEQERLKDRLAALGQMAASMAHEIRNPLASIAVSCKLLSRRIEDRACHDLLKKITAETRRLNSTIDSSLSFVRPVRASLRPAELLPVLDEAITVATERRGRPGIVVRRRLPREIPAFQMDPELLGQVFVNLILNAFEAVGEQGTVTIEAECIDAPDEGSIPYEPSGSDPCGPWSNVKNFVVVRVCDTGPGISEGQQDRVFYPFFTTKERGSGVGLAIAKKIVGSHHGLIGIDSTPGAGTAFLVRLPMIMGSTGGFVA